MKFLLKCPKCYNESFQITNINFNQTYSDYQISFKCSRYNSLYKIYLRKLLLSLNKENPTTPSYCDYHQFNHAPFACSGCDNFFCKECYTEHLIEETENHHTEKDMICRLHYKSYCNYCEKCKKRVCNECIITKHIDHCDWKYLTDTKENLHKKVNEKIKVVDDIVNNSITFIDHMIEKANRIKKEINETYSNFLNVSLPLINLYKILIGNTIFEPSNKLHETINCFDFSYSISGAHDIFKEMKEKFKKEYDIMNDSLNILKKGMYFVFSKLNFHFSLNKAENTKQKNKKDDIGLEGIFTKVQRTIPFTHCISKLTEHTGTIYSMTNLSNGTFSTASADGTIIIWDTNLLKYNVSIKAHTQSVNTIIEHNQTLITCSNDCSIKIWSNTNFDLIHKILLNQPVISIFSLSSDLIVSFSGDELKVWSMKDYVCTFTCKTPDTTLVSHIEGNLFAAGKEDNSIFVFDIFNSNNLNKAITLVGNTDNVSAITSFGEGMICSGSYDGNIMLWDLNKKKKEYEIKQAHDYVIHVIILLKDNVSFASASNDKKIKIWDIITKQCNICIQDSHESSIRSMIQLINGKIASGSSDETVKIWG